MLGIGSQASFLKPEIDVILSALDFLFRQVILQRLYTVFTDRQSDKCQRMNPNLADTFEDNRRIEITHSTHNRRYLRTGWSFYKKNDKLKDALGLNKYLKQIKLPNLRITYTSYPELPPDMSTIKIFCCMTHQDLHNLDCQLQYFLATLNVHLEDIEDPLKIYTSAYRVSCP